MINIIYKNSTIPQNIAKLAWIIKKRLPYFKRYKYNSLIDITLAKTAQLKKRNVVSCFPFLQAPISDRRSLTSTIAVTTLFTIALSSLLAHPLLAATRSIQEENYRIHPDMVQYSSANTFLITSADVKTTQACGSPLTNNCPNLPIVHFQFGESTLSSSERESLLDGLHRCEITKSTPLHITGYTCALGHEEANRVLSFRRARVVAGVLQAVGYTVHDKDIQGRGKENSLTNDPNTYAMNRRVEISWN